MEGNEALSPEDVLASFEQDFGTATQEPEPTNDEGTSGEGEQSAQPNDGTATGAQNEEGTTEPPAQQTTPPATQTPDNKAFASLRVQNKQMQEVLTALAKQQGIEGKPEEILLKLKEQTLLEQAKKDGIPEPVAKELAALREKGQQYEQFQVQQIARIGFQKVKNDFGLTSEQLEDFANQLMKEGLNPFQQTLDLPMEFLKRNFSSLVKQAEERGAAKEAERLNKVDTQGSAPNSKSSVGNSGSAQAPKINSVSDLETWLAENIK